jgi:pimeloyl-ACP methyl ester carboxylesterase
MNEELSIRIFGDETLPTLVYLPGMHGDCTLIPAFRLAVQGQVRLVEITYPRTLTWTIPDYGRELNAALLAAGINGGWLLAESFGSQPAWALQELSTSADATGSVAGHFRIQGIILAAGFVKHPWTHGPGALRLISRSLPHRASRALFQIHAASIRLQHGRQPEVVADAREFVKRRTPLDRQAIRHRLQLLDHYDPRPVAMNTRLPVHYLAGALDPLVPWLVVIRWLRRHCPGYRGSRTLWLANHNVLLTAPRACARSVVQWMQAAQLLPTVPARAGAGSPVPNDIASRGLLR